jgi:hypothetical protein
MKVPYESMADRMAPLLEGLVPIKGKLKPYQRIVFRAFVEHMTEGQIKITLRPQKRRGKKIGDVRYEDLERGKADIRFLNAGSLLMSMGYIAHEMTHVRQYIRGHLRVEDGMFLWHGKPHTSVKDYAAITNYAKYAKLPWEAEAIRIQKTLPRQWLRSSIPSLKGKDRTLDYLIDNDLLLY